MKATELKSEGLKKEFKIVIPAKDFEQKVDDKLNEVPRTSNSPVSVRARLRKPC